jgi:hypothetical protein
MLRGSCLCSKIHYEIDGPVTDMTNCHCGMCRKAHGAAFATVLTAQEKDFRWTRGAEFLETYPSSKELNRLFCRVCGSSLAVTEPKTGEVFVTAGTLDEDPGVRPGSHIFVGSKAPWLDILDEKPRFDEYPPDEN